MDREKVPNSDNKEKENPLDWLRKFKKEIEEITDNQGLAKIIITNVEHNLLDANFFNMVAVSINEGVKKKEISEEKAKEIFTMIEKKVNKYASLYQEKDLIYNKLLHNFEYLEKE